MIGGLKLTACAAAVAAILYLLYQGGCLAVQSKKALVYAGSFLGGRARFSRCSGSVRRILRVQESRIYRFDFALELTGGEVTAELTDRSGQQLFRLDQTHQAAEVPLQRGEKYRLVIRYRSAGGKHDLRYQ